MSTNKPPRAKPQRQKRSAPPPRPPGLPPFSSIMANAHGDVSAALTLVKQALNTSAGALMVHFLMVEDRSPEETAKLMGITHAQLRAEGLEFAARLSNAVAPDLFPLTACTAEELEVKIARAKAFETTASALGTLI